jgi:hypothetical protein
MPENAGKLRKVAAAWRGVVRRLHRRDDTARTDSSLAPRHDLVMRSGSINDVPIVGSGRARSEQRAPAPTEVMDGSATDASERSGGAAIGQPR